MARPMSFLVPTSRHSVGVVDGSPGIASGKTEE
jgi:hypothetical protein